MTTVALLSLFVALVIMLYWNRKLQREVHARIHAEAEIKKLSLAIEQSPSAIFITDIDGVIEYVNPKLCEITGYSEAECIDHNPSLFGADEPELDVHQQLWSTILSAKEWRGELKNKRKNDELYWANVHIGPITDSHNKITHFVATIEDITESRRISEEVHHRANHDMLTDLINRNEFENRLNRIVASSHKDGATHALCFLDLDNFKQVNDTCGHIAGDELLRQLAVLLHDKVRQRDTLARIGGDEFAILMEHCNLHHAERAANDIRKLVEGFQFHWDSHNFRIGVSIGITLIEQSSFTPTEVLKQADLACYAAKQAGRNRVHIYELDDEEFAKQEGDTRWSVQINEALRNNRFQLYVQPILATDSTQAGYGYEIFIRLKNIHGEIVMPGSFFPAAERYNFAYKLDLWVIENAFQWIAANLDRLDHVNYFSINLSGSSINNQEVINFISAQFESKVVPATKITFEITESTALGNLHAATEFISKIKAFGCTFALDNFGSALSSFAYLKNLPVDYLKIDGLFVQEIINSPMDDALVKSINDIGHVLGLKTTAEFVENKEIHKRLDEIGVDYVQGYGIDKPIPINEIFT